MIKETVKTLLRHISKKVLLEDFAMEESSARVKAMRKVEAEVKKAYKINPKVIYIEEQFKPLFHRPGINGTYANTKNRIVVYVNKDYKANLRTLCHELTHSYQHVYQTAKYIKSCEDLHSGKTTYKAAWHEVDARKQAELMCSYYYSLRRAA